MWIILLDRSTSMGGGFVNARPSGRLVRTVDAESRLAAAKACLLEELTRQRPDLPVAVFAFNETPRLVLADTAGATARFTAALDNLAPDDGTDIAAALNAAVDYLKRLPTQPTVRRVLLISDGESALDPAKQAAERCHAAGVSVDMFLIDPGDEGTLLARTVCGVGGGRWEPVTSARELEAGISRASRHMTAEDAAWARVMEHWESGEQAAAAQRQGLPDVVFTAGYPGRIAASGAHPLLFCIHLESAQAEVEASLKRALGPTVKARLSSADARSRIPRGTLLRVEPRISGLLVEPLRAEALWLEETIDLRFIVTAEAGNAGAVCRGAVEVTDERGLPLGETPLSITIAPNKEVAQEPPTVARARMPEQVFASYAREDADIVRACKEAYRALGVHLFVDRDDLLTGQAWRNTLELAIGRSDLFQLYWSQHAAESSNVAEEWQLALVVGEQRGGDFVRPLYWHIPKPKAPDALNRLHFGFLNIHNLEIASSPAAQHAPKHSLELEQQIVVLPLTTKPSDATQAFGLSTRFSG